MAATILFLWLHRYGLVIVNYPEVSFHEDINWYMPYPRRVPPRQPQEPQP